ncbi:MAG: transglutaminase-like domain-containing protein [Planctomycetota bacterium]|nr:transglutaminase-like domain-containing protein [Planctomycetota bacterium]
MWRAMCPIAMIAAIALACGLPGCIFPEHKTPRDMRRASKPTSKSNIAAAEKGSAPSNTKTATPLAADGEKVYFVTEDRGERRSRGYRVRTCSTYKGQPCVVVETRKIREFQRDNQIFSEETRQRIITAPNGAALFSEELAIAGDERREERVTIEKDQAVIETIGPEGRKRRSIKVPAGVLFSIHPQWLIAQGVIAGQEYQAPVLDTKAGKVALERALIQGRRREQVLGTEQDVWIAQTAREGSDLNLIMYFTDAGDLVRLEAGDIVFRLVTKEEMEQPQPPLRVASAVKTDCELPAWDAYAEMVFDLEPAAVWRRFIHDSEYAEVVPVEGGGLRVVLRKLAPAVKRLTLPLEVPEEIKPFLAASDLILPQRPEIASKAKSVIKSETDALNAVALLAGGVHRWVRFRSSSAANISPLKALEEGVGDCSEHAALFSSLARSQGIPTRHCHGLLVQRDRAVYHAWVEVWLAGVWVPVDTTVNRVGVPAGYLLTARCQGDGQPSDEFPREMRRGDLRMHLVQATMENLGRKLKATLIPDNPQTYVYAKDDNWMANLYWGFSLEKPAGWKGVVKFSSVECISADGLARVVCEAMPRPYSITSADLEQLVQNLRRHLDDFRCLESRTTALATGARVPGVPRRATSEALFVDFTCKQDRQALRCQQFLVTKRERSCRLSMWAPAERFDDLSAIFKAVIDSFEM